MGDGRVRWVSSERMVDEGVRWVRRRGGVDGMWRRGGESV